MSAILFPEAMCLVEPVSGQVSWGANQLWYGDLWQRKAGCGPSTAASLIFYQKQKQRLLQRKPLLSSRQCLLDQIQTFAPQTDVLLISPIYLGEKVWQEGYDQDFSPQSVTVSKELETVYERIAAERQIGYLRASDYVQCSEADQEHLNAQGHQIFAQAVYEKTERMLWKRSGWRQVV